MDKRTRAQWLSDIRFFEDSLKKHSVTLQLATRGSNPKLAESEAFQLYQTIAEFIELAGEEL